MNYKIIHKPAFNMIGIGIRTSNQNFMQEVPPLWQRFNMENLAEQIPNRLDRDILVLYTDYEDNYTKPFTYIIGCRVANLRQIPTQMMSRAVPAADYAVYTSKGKMPDFMIKTWQQIRLADSELERTYLYDFEIYGEKSRDRDNTEIEVYLGTHKDKV